jgi:hypothetical protein
MVNTCHCFGKEKISVKLAKRLLENGGVCLQEINDAEDFEMSTDWF